jgi:hypothetical protein
MIEPDQLRKIQQHDDKAGDVGAYAGKLRASALGEQQVNYDKPDQHDRGVTGQQ